MNIISLNSKRVILCVCGILFTCALGAHAAPQSATPDNAALLYYQAFLLLPDFNPGLINPVLDGADPNQAVRDYVEGSREAIELADTATKIPDCTWGIMRWQSGRNFTEVIGQLRRLNFLLELDARILAVDGEPRLALERSLGIRRLAQHISDEAIIGYLASLAIHNRAYSSIGYIVGATLPDADILAWLQSQLGFVQGPPSSPAKAMEITLADTVQFLRANPEYIALQRDNILSRIEDESARQEIIDLSDEELLALAEQSYSSFLASVNRLMERDMPYLQKQAELQQLRQELSYQVSIGDPVCIISSYMLNDDMAEWYRLYLISVARFNILRMAIEIRIIMSEAGQLPEVLPSGMPKDPFSDQNFDYEKTEGGFILRCREKDISENEIWEYEFKVKSKD